MKADDFFYETSRNIKRLLTLLIDTGAITFSFWAAYAIREESFAVFFQPNIWLIFAFLVPLSLIFYIKLGVYRSYQRFFGAKSILFTFFAITLSALSLVVANIYVAQSISPIVALLYFVFLALLTGMARIALRLFYSMVTSSNKKQVVIYGAGEAGRQLAKSLVTSPEYATVAFIDDDTSLHGFYIDGIKVYAFKDIQKLIDRYHVERVLLAMPSAPRAFKKRVLEKLEMLPVKVKTIPGVVDLVEGDAQFSDVKDVEIEDLLGRDPVPPKQELFEANIKGLNVLVTGAGGSIGSELCRQIIKNAPAKLVLFEVSEFALYSIESELAQFIAKQGVEISLIPVLGSVQDRTLIDQVLASQAIDTIYHAAAYKHVPLVEFNVVQGVRNNVFGTLNVAQAAKDFKVPTCVLVSTDKAVRPTNFMGTTKRVAELVLQALQNETQHTRYCMVRFGNVLGSSGSVIPLFRRQIEAGGPVTVTHQDITRYFMTIPEAAQLVIQAGAMGQGGDVYVLDMGESVKIFDLAKRLIRLSGLEVKDEANPNGDIEIVCSGLRPGEKLFEELLIGDNVKPTNHERIMSAHEVMLSWPDLQKFLAKLDKACAAQQVPKIRELLVEAPTGYAPNSNIVDNFTV